MECPEVSELIAYLESGRAEEVLLVHVRGCDACQETLETLEDEIISLQISISELWFRNRVSCPHREVLRQHLDGDLSKDAAAYVRFHVEDLGCEYCQGRLEAEKAGRTPDGRRSLERSRSRLGEATSVLLDDLHKQG